MRARERKGETKPRDGETKKDSRAESARDGHVRFPAPQLAPLHTNIEPETVWGLDFNVTVNLNFAFMWPPYKETKLPSAQDVLGDLQN